MPRRQKTQTGEQAQSIDSVPGQRYGEGQDQQALQAILPAPDVAAGSPSTSGSPVAPPAIGGAPVDGAAAQEYLARTQPKLLAGSQSPNEPVTAGLSRGPGVGPSALAIGRSTTPLARTMENLARETGNSKWSRLAQRAGL